MTNVNGAKMDMDDARWFAVDLDVVRRNVHFLHLGEEVVERATFVDNRLPVDNPVLTRVPLEQLDVPASKPAWLWHTSFCGSTLLARMLHLAPYSVSLREPLVLRRLSDAADSAIPIQEYVEPLIALLSRPWHPGGQVVIKPTHAALNIAARLMAATPDSRGLALTSSLDDFLTSHLKKTTETLTKTGLLAERALRAGSFRQRLGPNALQPPNPLAAAALQWAAQRELVAELRDQAGSRLRVMDWGEAQRNLPAAAQLAAGWLELRTPAEKILGHATALARTHAKAPGRPYDVAARQREIAWLNARYGEVLTQARRWADQHVLLHMRPDAISL